MFRSTVLPHTLTNPEAGGILTAMHFRAGNAISATSMCTGMRGGLGRGNRQAR